MSDSQIFWAVVELLLAGWGAFALVMVIISQTTEYFESPIKKERTRRTDERNKRVLDLMRKVGLSQCDAETFVDAEIEKEQSAAREAYKEAK